MWIDIAIAIVLIICIFRGEKRGLLLSLINTFGWIITLAAAYILRPSLVSYMDEHTEVRQDITNKVADYIKNRLSEQAAGVSTGDIIPGSIASRLASAADYAIESAATEAAGPVVDMFIAFAAFWLLIIGIKIIVCIIERILRAIVGGSKTLGAIDSIGGMLFGLLRGCIIGYIIIILLCLISVLLLNTQALSGQIQDSMTINFLSDRGLIPFSDELFSVLKMQI